MLKCLLASIFFLSSLLLKADPRIVVIDAGHGGTQVLDHSSPNNAQYRSAVSGKTFYEKDLTLEVATETIRLINLSDQVKALSTRTKDVNVGMKDRANVAIAAKAEALISIHFNSTPSATGPLAVVQATAYQGKPANTPEQLKRDKAMGDHLARAVASVSSRYLPNTKARPSQLYAAKPEGSHLFRYLREAPAGKTIDACFLEIDFMDNPKVAAWLLESPLAEQARKEIAAALAEAIITYVSQK